MAGKTAMGIAAHAIIGNTPWRSDRAIRDRPRVGEASIGPALLRMTLE